MYSADQKSTGLDTLDNTTIANGDLAIVGDVSDSGRAKGITWTNLKAFLKAYFDTLYPSGSGTSTGTNTGDQTSVSGNAGTATALEMSRTIWGQSFNGTANVTGSITLGANNLTMTGSLAATGARVTKGWFTDIESTNMPTVGGTSLSSTFAPIASPTFTGLLTTPTIKITSGSPGAGKVLTSDADGDATWETPSGSDWTTLANVTLGGAAGSISSGTFAVKKVLRITCTLVQGGSTQFQLRFNNDSGNNYTYSYSKNGGSDNRLTNQDGIVVMESAAENGFAVLNIANNLTSIKKFVTGSAVNDSNRYENGSLWQNVSSQITRVDFIGTSTNFAAGTQLIVEGRD